MDYNVNKKVSNFGDFCDNIEAEKEETKKVRRSITKNSDRQQFPKNSRFKYNAITRKMDDKTKDILDDEIENIEEIEDMKSKNESIISIDDELYEKIVSSVAYKDLKSKVAIALNDFIDQLTGDEIGYDSNDPAQVRAYELAISELL